MQLDILFFGDLPAARERVFSGQNIRRVPISTNYPTVRLGLMIHPSLAQLTLVSGKSIACIIVSKYIHAQHFAKEFTPRVNVTKVLGVRVAIQNRGGTSPEPARPSCQGYAHLQLLRRAYLWRRRHRRVLIWRMLV